MDIDIRWLFNDAMSITYINFLPNQNQWGHTTQSTNSYESFMKKGKSNTEIFMYVMKLIKSVRKIFVIKNQ